MSGSHLSRDLFDLVKSIGECRSKAEEDRLITAESSQLKVAIKQPDVSPSKAREFMIRSIYIEMLGHDASFSHIFAVKQVHDEVILCERHCRHTHKRRREC